MKTLIGSKGDKRLELRKKIFFICFLLLYCCEDFLFKNDHYIVIKFFLKIPGVENSFVIEDVVYSTIWKIR